MASEQENQRVIRNLDRSEKCILEELKRKGRLLIVELSSRANLTNTPCSERVKRLKQMGFISGYRAVLNMEKPGLGHLAGASDGGAGDSGRDGKRQVA